MISLRHRRHHHRSHHSHLTLATETEPAWRIEIEPSRNVCGAALGLYARIGEHTHLAIRRHLSSECQRQVLAWAVGLAAAHVQSVQVLLISDLIR